MASPTDDKRNASTAELVKELSREVSQLVREEIALANSNASVYSVPSSPDPDADGFNACAWSTSCSAPGSS